jgi:hypothetical protein
MGEIIRGKRRRCLYDKADDEILIKRQRLNSEGDSNDSADNDMGFTYQPPTVKPAAERTSEVSFKCESGKVNSNDGITTKQSAPAVTKTSPRLRKRSVVEPVATMVHEASAVVEVGEDVVASMEEDEADVPEDVAASIKDDAEPEDLREMNRRSPNGFLLPDPLPKGELLRDTLGQVRI